MTRAPLISLAACVALLGIWGVDPRIARADDDRSLETCNADAMLVFDSSGSMKHREDTSENTRIDSARRAAHSIIPKLADGRKLGLVTFGPGDTDQCGNVAMPVPPQSHSSRRILNEIDSLTTDGGTPLSTAVEMAAHALDNGGQPAMIVVVTDGDDTCGRDPCATARAIKEKSPSLTVHVIGIDTGLIRKASCFADETKGSYFTPSDSDQLATALEETLKCPEVAARHSAPIK